MQLSRQLGSDEAANNVRFVQNLVDWATADVDLLAIRSRGAETRTLTVPEDRRERWEWINYAIAVLALGAVIGASALRRRAVVPMALDPARQGAGEVVR
jgi:hypothetical protein